MAFVMLVLDASDGETLSANGHYTNGKLYRTLKQAATWAYADILEIEQENWDELEDEDKYGRSAKRPTAKSIRKDFPLHGINEAKSKKTGARIYGPQMDFIIEQVK